MVNKYKYVAPAPLAVDLPWPSPLEATAKAEESLLVEARKARHVQLPEVGRGAAAVACG